MEFREVTPEETAILIERSSDKEHPYYYLFRYSLNEHRIIAKRIRKKAIAFTSERKRYHAVDIEPGRALHQAMEKISDLKSKYPININASL